MNLALAYGGTLVTLPRFELPAFLAAVQEHRITVAHIVPPIAIAFAHAPASTTTTSRSLRLVASGAAPLDEATARARRRAGSAVPSRRGSG